MGPGLQQTESRPYWIEIGGQVYLTASNLLILCSIQLKLETHNYPPLNMSDQCEGTNLNSAPYRLNEKRYAKTTKQFWM